MPSFCWLLALLVTASASFTAGSDNASRRILQDAAMPTADPALGQCCDRLEAIGFSSNLPVAVLETGGQKIKDKGVDVDVQLCTCNSGGAGRD
jgi:hypothetical protein